MALTYTFQMPGNFALRPVTVYSSAGVQQTTGTTDSNARFTASLAVGDYYARVTHGRISYDAAGTVDRGDEDGNIGGGASDGSVAALVEDDTSDTRAALSATFASLDEDDVLVIGGVPVEVGGDVADATTTTKGIVEMATTAEAVTGTDTARAVTPLGVATAAAAQDDQAAARQAFGSRGTPPAPVQPWRPAPTYGPELWKVDNIQTGGGVVSTSTSLAPSITTNGSEQIHRTRIKVGNTDDGNPNGASGDYKMRIEFDYTLAGLTGGAAGISIQWTDAVGALVGGTAEQWLVTRGSPKQSGRIIFEFDTPAANVYPPVVEIKLNTKNNVPAGQTMGISNVTLKTITKVTRPLLVSSQYQGAASVHAYTSQRDARSRAWKIGSITFDADGTLAAPFGASVIDAWGTDNIWTNPFADPNLLSTATNAITNGGNQQATSSGMQSMRSNNNDQIIEVWNGSAWELRGNIHNGEFARGAAAWKVDRGAGFVSWTPAHGLEGVWRLQGQLNSEMRRSTDGTTPFANVDKTYTVFPDGMVRVDRTTTYLVDTQVRLYLEWMSSHSNVVPYLGRLGRGLEVLGDLDTHAQLTTPVISSVTTSGAGGTLPAGTHSYRVAAFTPYGETLGSTAVTVASSGSTSANTVNWSAVTSASGYLIFGRTTGAERLLARVGAVTTWVDDGSIVAGTTAPVTVPTARLYTNNSSTALKIGQLAENDVSWAVLHEPRTGWCLANNNDRTATLARPQVKDVRTRLMAGSGVHKNYTDLKWAGDVGSVTIPAGTAWSATHWTYLYLPGDPVDYHREAAVRGANLDALKTLYPVV